MRRWSHCNQLDLFNKKEEEVFKYYCGQLPNDNLGDGAKKKGTDPSLQLLNTAFNFCIVIPNHDFDESQKEIDFKEAKKLYSNSFFVLC